MPNYDGTGPTGIGPQNGMGRGGCMGNTNGFQGRGRFIGNMRGRRFGRRSGFTSGKFMNNCRFYEDTPITLDEEKTMLKQRLDEIEKIQENDEENN